MGFTWELDAHLFLKRAEFVISTALVDIAAGSRRADTVLLGYGIEQLATPAERADVLGWIMEYLLA